MSNQVNPLAIETTYEDGGFTYDYSPLDPSYEVPEGMHHSGYICPHGEWSPRCEDRKCPDSDEYRGFTYLIQCDKTVLLTTSYVGTPSGTQFESEQLLIDTIDHWLDDSPKGIITENTSDAIILVRGLFDSYPNDDRIGELLALLNGIRLQIPGLEG